MIIYRPMTFKDCEAVSLLYKDCFSTPWSLSAIKDMFFVEGYCSFVAELLEENNDPMESHGHPTGRDTSRIIGYVGMKTVFDEADITNVAVSPDWRKQGIAGTLLNTLLEEGKKRGIHSIFLEVRISNAAAITLYSHASFAECGKRKNYYQAPEEDALLMVWNS